MSASHLRKNEPNNREGSVCCPGSKPLRLGSAAQTQVPAAGLTGKSILYLFHLSIDPYYLYACKSGLPSCISILLSTLCAFSLISVNGADQIFFFFFFWLRQLTCVFFKHKKALNSVMNQCYVYT